LKEGRKRIALATTESYFNVSEKRADGYRQALNEYGMEVDNDLVLVLPYNDIQESMIEDFYDRAKVDAILSVNEIFAIQCISVAKKRGMKIPEDISFIGFTDGLLSRYSNPTLTVVAQHGVKMGEIAAKMLIDRVESEAEGSMEDTYRTEIVQATILDRESTIN